MHIFKTLALWVVTSRWLMDKEWERETKIMDLSSMAWDKSNDESETS